MRKILLMVLICWSFFLPKNFVSAAYEMEQIDEYTVNIEAFADGKLLVEERILYNFGSWERHGIFREIPLIYGGDEVVNISLNVLSIEDERGNPYMYQPEGYSNLILKIGDPDSFVTDKKWYVLTYEVSGAITSFVDHNELYWNAVGQGWDVPIQQASAQIILPAGKTSFREATCYTGSQGSPFQNCTAQVASSTTYKFETTDMLYPSQGFTIVAGFEKGVVAAPTVLEIETPEYFVPFNIDGLYAGYAPTTLRLSPGTHTLTIDDWHFLPVEKTITLAEEERRTLVLSLQRTWLARFVEDVLPFLSFLLAVFFPLWWWNKQGRDPKGRGAVYAHYEPPQDLTPAEIGVIVDQQAHMRDISATIIHLAVQGYLKIQKEGKGKTSKYTFILQELWRGKTSLKNFEQEILQALFGKNPQVGKEVRLSSLKNKFYASLEKIRSALYQEVVQQGYFLKNPGEVKMWAIFWSIFVGVPVCIGGVFLGLKLDAHWYIAAGISFLGLRFFLAFFMPKCTPKGAEMREKILGFRLFLESTEKKMLEFLNSPQKYQGKFEAFLPYAVALDVERAWSKKFTNIYQQPPEWYDAAGAASFSQFTRDLRSFQTVQQKTFTSSPSSSSGSGSWSGGSGFSGGSSGGGFGGGGGGSW